MNIPSVPGSPVPYTLTPEAGRLLDAEPEPGLYEPGPSLESTPGLEDSFLAALAAHEAYAERIDQENRGIPWAEASHEEYADALANAAAAEAEAELAAMEEPEAEPW